MLWWLPCRRRTGDTPRQDSFPFRKRIHGRTGAWSDRLSDAPGAAVARRVSASRSLHECQATRNPFSSRPLRGRECPSLTTSRSSWRGCTTFPSRTTSTGLRSRITCRTRTRRLSSGWTSPRPLSNYREVGPRPDRPSSHALDTRKPPLCLAAKGGISFRYLPEIPRVGALRRVCHSYRRSVALSLSIAAVRVSASGNSTLGVAYLLRAYCVGGFS